MNGESAQNRLFAWAWPKGTIDQLLRAAAHVDQHHAQAAWRQWTHGRDLDDVGFNEMRLLAGVALRLDRLDPSQPERNRIVGIARSLWSRSQLVLREIQPAIETLRHANIEVMALKGVGRVARNPAALKFRFVNDVDILVRPHEFRRAFELLDAAGWQSTAAGSAKYHRTLLDHVHGLNLIRGEIGDLDLHRSAIHHPHQSLPDDELMWARAGTGAIAQCPVRVLSDTDTMIVALAHGGSGGHRTSDWLLDIVDAIDRGGIDWELVFDAVGRRQLEVSAAVTWTYLAERLQRPIPRAAIDWAVKRAKRRPLDLASGLCLSRPKDDLGPPLKLVRALAKLWRHRGQNQETGSSSARVTRRAWPLLGSPSATVAPLEYQTPIRPPDREPGSPWQGLVEVTIAFPAPQRARRIEFELNVGNRHVARVKHRKWSARGKKLLLRFRAEIELQAGEGELVLEAAPGRGLRPNASPQLIERYSRLPFSLSEVTFRRRAA
jgi:hypothetical protein